MEIIKKEALQFISIIKYKNNGNDGKNILLIVQKDVYRMPISHLIEYTCNNNSMITELENKFSEAFKCKISANNILDYTAMIETDKKVINFVTIYNSLIKRDELFDRNVSKLNLFFQLFRHLVNITLEAYYNDGPTKLGCYYDLIQKLHEKFKTNSLFMETLQTAQFPFLTETALHYLTKSDSLKFLFVNTTWNMSVELAELNSTFFESNSATFRVQKA